jgi:hypothetical protein
MTITLSCLIFFPRSVKSRHCGDGVELVEVLLSLSFGMDLGMRKNVSSEPIFDIFLVTLFIPLSTSIGIQGPEITESPKKKKEKKKKKKKKKKKQSVMRRACTRSRGIKYKHLTHETRSTCGSWGSSTGKGVMNAPDRN